ncbi:GlxA family transcriptional regulator [Segeticoccus rhizosphaerae]|uniref:GlxA family transcriptional regulator n=1 Tax=Segeticoccus rhizosphaerae TaxID=1104777 RepID=UPI001264281F|nr:helix-turn-helix domain-containing protein [Segeticoccus rhizosphaerae]
MVSVANNSPAAKRAPRSGRRPHKVAVVVTRGLPIFELAVPCEVFGIDRSDLVDPWYDFRFVAGQAGDLSTTGGFHVHPESGLDYLDEADTVIVPACDRVVQIEPPQPLLEALRRAHDRGARIASLCSGSYVLAAAGLLDGRRATSHWMNLDDFAARYPRVHVDHNVLFTDNDGTVLTSAGTAASIDLCLHLVRHDFGAGVAASVARRMVIPAQREGGQAQYVDRDTEPVPPPAVFGDMLEWVSSHLDEPLTVADLARRASLSRRHFHRNFVRATGQTPLQWGQSRRVRRAQELLESTDLSVEQIATRTGFANSNTLRTHFVRAVTVSPQQYRRNFSEAAAS